MVESDSLVVADGKTKWNEHQLWLGRFRIDSSKIFFSLRRLQNSGTGVREAIKSPSLEVFQMLNSLCSFSKKPFLLLLSEKE